VGFMYFFESLRIFCFKFGDREMKNEEGSGFLEQELESIRLEFHVDTQNLSF